MLDKAAEDHAARLAVFDIKEQDIAALRRHRDRVLHLMPVLLGQLDRGSTAGPAVTAALLDPTLKEARDTYWQCIASGELGGTFVRAATRFASITCSKGIPSKAFTIRHSAGARILVDGLFGKASSLSETSWAKRIFRRGLGGKQRAEYAGAVQKALWLGLSIVLEAYAEAEAREKSAASDTIERSFSERIAGIADVLHADSDASWPPIPT